MIAKRVEFIDFAKGFAILSIVIFHYLQPYASGLWAKAIMVGGAGVHLFFILSGFGLGLSSTNNINFFSFLKKRFTKLLTPYFLAILLIILTNYVVPIYVENTLYAIGGHFLLYKMFDENIIGSYGYHFWFVSTIIQLYIFYPLIINIKNKLSSKYFLIGSLAVSIIYWITISLLELSEKRIFNSFFLQYLWEFSLGIVIAEKYIDGKDRFFTKNIYILALTSILGLLLMSIMALKGGSVGKMFNDLPASIGYSCLAATCYLILSNLEKVRTFVSNIGKVSYELYLLHMLIFILLNKVLLNFTAKKPDIFTAIFLILPISLVSVKFYAYLVNFIVNKISALTKNHNKLFN